MSVRFSSRGYCSCFRLNDLAYTRSGDKGDSCNVGVIARHPAFLPYIRLLTNFELYLWNITEWEICQKSVTNCRRLNCQSIHMSQHRKLKYLLCHFWNSLGFFCEGLMAHLCTKKMCKAVELWYFLSCMDTVICCARYFNYILIIDILLCMLLWKEDALKHCANFQQQNKFFKL